MPHVPDVEKTHVIETGKADSVGQLCWLFADKAIDQWNVNPRWATAHAIKRALKNPYHVEWSHEVIIKYAGSFDRQDIETAAELAFFELYRLVFSRYENAKIEENGNALARAILPETNVVGNGYVPVQPITPVIEAAVEVVAQEFTRKRGRPAGSKNKVKTEVA